MGIALADRDVPGRAAEWVERVAKALSAHLRGQSKLPGLEKFENLGRSWPRNRGINALAGHTNAARLGVRH